MQRLQIFCGFKEIHPHFQSAHDRINKMRTGGEGRLIVQVAYMIDYHRASTVTHFFWQKTLNTDPCVHPSMSINSKSMTVHPKINKRMSVFWLFGFKRLMLLFLWSTSLRTPVSHIWGAVIFISVCLLVLNRTVDGAVLLSHGCCCRVRPFFCQSSLSHYSAAAMRFYVK